MSVKVGDIKSFTLITGMEVLGEVAAINDGYFEVREAFGVMVAEGEGGQINVQLRPLAAFATHESPTGGLPVELYFSTILLSTNTPQGLLDHYANATGKILTPPEKKIVTR